MTKAIIIAGNMRKQALSANYAAIGLKVNTTIVAAAVNAAVNRSSANNRAEDGSFEMHISPRSSANYLNGFFPISGWAISSSGATAIAYSIPSFQLDLPFPNATITSVVIRAVNNVASNAVEVFGVSVLTY